MSSVYYFSRTGDSEKIAKDISRQTKGKVFQITDSLDWKGMIGFIRGGYYAVSEKKTSAIYEKPKPNEVVYLCFPVWAGAFPPAVRTFIDDVKRDKIIAVPTSRSSHLKDTEGFKEVIEVIGKDKTVRLSSKND